MKIKSNYMLSKQLDEFSKIEKDIHHELTTKSLKDTLLKNSLPKTKEEIICFFKDNMNITPHQGEEIYQLYVTYLRKSKHNKEEEKINEKKGVDTFSLMDFIYSVKFCISHNQFSKRAVRNVYTLVHDAHIDRSNLPLFLKEPFGGLPLQEMNPNTLQFMIKELHINDYQILNKVWVMISETTTTQMQENALVLKHNNVDIEGDNLYYLWAQKGMLTILFDNTNLSIADKIPIGLVRSNPENIENIENVKLVIERLKISDINKLEKLSLCLERAKHDTLNYMIDTFLQGDNLTNEEKIIFLYNISDLLRIKKEYLPSFDTIEEAKLFNNLMDYSLREFESIILNNPEEFVKIRGEDGYKFMKESLSNIPANSPIKKRDMVDWLSKL